MMDYFLTAFFIHFALIIALFYSGGGASSGKETVEIEIQDSGKVLLPDGKQGKTKSEDTPIKADKGTKRSNDNKPPGQKGPPVDMSVYANQIKVKVDPVWYRNIQPYLRSCRTLNNEIFISVSNDGRISNVSVFKSSGNRDFDRIALDTLREVGSLPKPPEVLVTEGIIWSFSCGS